MRCGRLPTEKKALDLLCSAKPDLMLLDVMMASDTEGFDLAFKLKEDPEFRGLPSSC